MVMQGRALAHLDGLVRQDEGARARRVAEVSAAAAPVTPERFAELVAEGLPLLEAIEAREGPFSKSLIGYHLERGRWHLFAAAESARLNQLRTEALAWGDQGLLERVTLDAEKLLRTDFVGDGPGAPYPGAPRG